ncbi:hypothetical protein SCLCIDRAFT_122127 [Scleroderma citrinum Foug A]|uniref:Uncharacterized protein n=1 Tax=Scleroderma citrinum Foug A TaxID=1036808 RepID=A0A0C3DZR8_9AGAM|nr:hypothetical protein SCLCIDRAFT_122127 [Scleroderma citrinum Foug A]
MNILLAHNTSAVRKQFNSPIYGFFEQPQIVEANNRCAQEFRCCKCGCMTCMRRFLDTKDAGLTRNLQKHVQTCWGIGVVNAADTAADANEVLQKIIPNILKDGSITMSFKLKKGKTTYSHHAHTPGQTKGFQSLMKTGRPAYYIPLRCTVSHDVRLIFTHTQNCITKMLQEYNGKLNFTTDAWTVPNHHAFIAFCVHLEHNGTPLTMPLDIVEVPKVSGRLT